MRTFTVILALFFATLPAQAQECKRKHDEFDQEDMIECQQSSAVRYIGDSDAVTGAVARVGWHETPDTPYLLMIQPTMSDVGEVMNLKTVQDRTADLIVDEWRGETRAETNYEGMNFRIAVGMTESLARRVARADTFKVRVGGWPFDVSPIIWQVARLLEMTTDASFGEKAKRNEEPGSNSDGPGSVMEEETTKPYHIEGLDREPVRTPLPRYADQVNARHRLQITVSPQGRIVQHSYLKGKSLQLREAVTDALDNWYFEPLLPNAPQKNETGTITFNFRLDSATQETHESIKRDGTQETEKSTKRDWECEKANETETFMVVENSPELLGGMEALQDSVDYPDFAKKAGIEGRVIVQFIVDEEGNVQDPKVTRGVHKLLNKAAIEAVKEVKFKPGMQRGQCVKVQHSLPVTFRLQ